MARVITETVGRYNQHYPKMVAVVTAQADGRQNAMTVAWHTSISFKPPLYGVSISPRRFTYPLIATSKEFAINFLPLEAAELVASIGGSRGKELDKFERFHIAVEKPLKIAAPILAAAYAAYECRLIDDKAYGDHQWLVGEIVATHVDGAAFTSEEALDLSRVSPALYLGKELYGTVDRALIRSLDRETYGKK